MEALEQVLDDVARDAAVIRQAGHGQQAAHLEGIIARVRAAASPYLTWRTEREAMLKSGHSSEWLRKRFPEWARSGNATRDPRRGRLYRDVVIPARVSHELEDDVARKVAGALR